ncbi:MAG: outer membrane lipoprotein carrier protein LolA [Treponema sp.]|nr:outer membrane lipoprotein carrier protein LolA [Treponema sp.]
MCYTFALAIIMKKIVKFAAVFLLASLSAFAFCETSLDDVLYSITSRKVTSGDFSQEKTAPNLKRPLKSSGTFIFCDTGILWKTVKPFPSTMAVTKDSLIMTAANGTKTVTDGSSNEVFKSVAQTLTSLFSGDRSELEKYFVISEYKSSGAEWSVSLAPKDRTISQALTKILLSGAADGKKSVLDNMVVNQSDGSTVKYNLMNQVYKEALTNEEKTLFAR